VQALLGRIRAEAKRNIMTDEVMISSARQTQNSVLIVSAVALIIGILIALFITRLLVAPIQKAKESIDRAADGDFTFEVDEKLVKRGDELGHMLKSVAAMRDKLSDTVIEVINQAESVANSANEISVGNQDLSDRTQSQASAIEETASSLEELTGSVRTTAQNSIDANQLAQKTSQMAREGGEVLQQTINAMSEVTDSSKKIADIIDMVNEIAFQTNLLALNAAVEAARAGEAGRGFAVVAGEVRNLAGRSAGAAKEIQQLISASVEKVERSNDLASQSGELLGDIINNVQSVADTIDEISASSQEQAQGIDEINRAITQMDEAVQQNAALVEEAAAASENQAAAAEHLRSEMSQFKVDGRKGGGTPLLTQS
jgi:methyl-accepting chemotaxis protein